MTPRRGVCSPLTDGAVIQQPSMARAARWLAPSLWAGGRSLLPLMVRVVYANLEDKSMVVEIDSQKLTVESRWPLAPGEEPSGMAIDREHRRLFSGCHNKMMVVMDADSGKVVATPPIGEGVDANAFDPGTGFAFSSNGDGTLTVVHQDSPDKYTVVDNVQTQRGARTMALDPKTHNVYLVTAEFGPPPGPTADQPRPRPSIVPGSFTVLVVGDKQDPSVSRLKLRAESA